MRNFEEELKKNSTYEIFTKLYEIDSNMYRGRKKKKRKKKTSPSFTLYLDYSYSMRCTVSSFTCGIFLWEICYLHAHNRYSIQMSNNPAARRRIVCSRGASFLSGNDFTVNYTPFQRTVPFCRFSLREFACDAIVDAYYNCD